MAVIKTDALLKEIRACRLCESHLPAGPRPIVQFSTSARIVIIGQAPGAKVHASGIPWQDDSGDRLREWAGLDKTDFYDAKKVALVPMGFCYPGTGKSGDLPPRPECAPLWHERILAKLPRRTLTLLVGSYAQARYLNTRKGQTLTENVRTFCDHLPGYFPLPHPSWRSGIWMKNNPWFSRKALPVLRAMVAEALARP